MPPTQPEQAGTVRDELERSLIPVALAALDDPTPSALVPRLDPAYEALVAAHTALLVGFIDATLAKRSKRSRPIPTQLAQAAATLAHDTAPVTQAAQDLAEWASDHIANLVAQDRAEELTHPTATQPWAQTAARSLATRLSSQASLEATRKLTDTVAEHHVAQGRTVRRPSDPTPPPSDAPVVDLPGFSKIWISRGDSRVRPLHRKLHGQPAPSEKPFWRWPLTGQTLAFPGDPEAPIDQTINCRCVLFHVPAEVSPTEVTDALAPSDYDLSFDLVAAAHPALARGLADFIDERAAAQ